MGHIEIKVCGCIFWLTIGHRECVRIIGTLSDLEFVKLVQRLRLELQNAHEENNYQVPELEWERYPSKVEVALKSRYFFAAEKREVQTDLLRHYVGLALRSVLHES